MSNDKCQYCGRPLAGEICPAHGYVGNPIPVAPFDPATSGVPTGAEMMWPVATPPAGWLIEDGSSQLITDHPALSALIRGTYGGADASHFYLPDGRGLVPVGYKSGDANFGTLGGTGGAPTHVLTRAQTPYKRSSDESGGYGLPVIGSFQDRVAVIREASGGEVDGTAHNNLQPFRTRNFVIKT